MQCIDFRKIAYLFMTSQEDSGTRREILKQALYFARLLLSLHRHSSQANYDLHKEAFFGSVPRNRNLENFTAGRWRKSIALSVLYTLMA